MNPAVVLRICAVAAGCPSHEPNGRWGAHATLTFLAGRNCGVRRLVVGRRSWRVDAARMTGTGVALRVVRPTGRFFRTIDDAPRL